MEILYANMSTKFKQVLEIHQKQLSGCAHAIPVEILRRLNAMYSQVLGAVKLRKLLWADPDNYSENTSSVWLSTRVIISNN